MGRIKERKEQMSKIKYLFIGLMICWLVGLSTTDAKAASIVHMNSLPNYETSNSFNISCTTDGTMAQFSYQKNGGSWTNFGSVINVATNPGGCIINVDSSVVNDQTSYNFMVTVDGTPSTNTVSTTYDVSGPSPVSGYWKEVVDGGHIRLHFHTPNDSDFDHVIIYRGTSPDFSADSSHQIAQVTEPKDTDEVYDDMFSPTSETYYYDIRAVDHAGNSSSLVGDGGSTTTTSSSQGSSPTPAGSGKVTILPKEQGSVLGTESSASASPTPEAISPSSVPSGNGAIYNFWSWIKTHKKISLGLAALLIALGYVGYTSIKKK